MISRDYVEWFEYEEWAKSPAAATTKQIDGKAEVVSISKHYPGMWYTVGNISSDYRIERSWIPKHYDEATIRKFESVNLCAICLEFNPPMAMFGRLKKDEGAFPITFICKECCVTALSMMK